MTRLSHLSFKYHDFSQGIFLGIQALVSQVDNPYNTTLSKLNIPISDSWWESYKKADQCHRRRGGYGYDYDPLNRCFNNEVKNYGGSGKW